MVGSAAVGFRKQYGGDAFRLVMAENMAPWLRAFSTSRWKIEGDWEKFADAWRRCVQEQFPVGGMLHLPQPPTVPPVGPAAPAVAVAKAVRKATPKPCPKKGLPQQYGSYSNIRVVLRHFGGELARWVEGAQRLPLVKARGGGPLRLAGRQTLDDQPPSPQIHLGPSGERSQVRPSSP